MRSPSRCLFLAVCIAVASAAIVVRAADEPTELKGNWKFSVLSPLSENELLILAVDDHAGKPSAEIKSIIAGPQFQSLKVAKFTREGDHVSFALNFPGFVATFEGTIVKGDKVPGILTIQGQHLPAELVKTDAEKVKAGEEENPLIGSYTAARALKDPKEKAKAWEELIGKTPGSPKVGVVYVELIKTAAAAGLDEQIVRKYVNEWILGAKPYGASLAKDVKVQALKALTGQKPYAGLALELAVETESGLDKDASKETRPRCSRRSPRPRSSPVTPTAPRDADAKAEKLQAELDEDYKKTVPPFKPEASLGRKDKSADRVVLLELFTGAQCPPCVAADVAFDALLETYKPSEVIALEYHLHIPGPDPLTNADSVTRRGILSRPPGHALQLLQRQVPSERRRHRDAQSKTKYDQYCQVIDKALDAKKRAKIDLEVTRSGDEIKIVATAQAEKKEADKDKDDKKDALKLRLVLIEEEIRYVGGNKMRFHHHVVRGFPGGVDGKNLTDGKGKAEATVKVSDVRKGLEAYLSDFAKQGSSFANTPPEPKLAHLSVVAFVQDEGTKSVLHAVLDPANAES